MTKSPPPDNMVTLDRARIGRRRCPVCQKPTVDSHRPFCSARCRDVDLGRWFGEVYRVSEPLEEGQDLPSPESDRDGS